MHTNKAHIHLGKIASAVGNRLLGYLLILKACLGDCPDCGMHVCLVQRWSEIKFCSQTTLGFLLSVLDI